ncbi:MAG: hypothetical protein M3209_09815 [Acidobacteriota bacterium]|nr:hypothetical protein [Acidobacteriota bacterium]
MTRKRYLRVRNFDNLQHYKTGDRNPIWVKLYCSILEDYEFQQLPDAAKFHAIGLLLLASRLSNRFPDDAVWLGQKIGASERINLELLIECEFLEVVKDEKPNRNAANVVNFPIENDENLSEKRATNARKAKKTKSHLASTVGETSEIRASAEKNRKEEIRIHTDTETDGESENRVCVNFAESSLSVSNGGANGKSQFSLEDCLRYAETCRARGDPIQNVNGLAVSLYKSGAADSLILATLYPEKHEEKQIEFYGEPRKFKDEHCTVCHGSKMEIVKGKGARECPHCIDERGRRTGKEPAQIEEGALTA